MNGKIFLAAAIAAAAIAVDAKPSASKAGDVKIATYRGAKAGAFFLYYDDGCNSTFEKALPVLIKYKVPATFYFFPSAGWFQKNQAGWVKAIKENPFLYPGNHTFKHSASPRKEDCERDINKGDETIRKLFGMPDKALLSFAKPGGVKWGANEEETRAMLAARNNVWRPGVNPNIAGGKDFKKYSDLEPLLEEAAEGYEVGVMFHGVGGDWFNFPADDHEKFIAELDKRRDKIWLCSTIEFYKYEQERAKAKAKGTLSGDAVKVNLTCGTDPEQFDEPLTLIVTIPADWTRVRVTQGDSVNELAPVKPGRLVCDVMPRSGEITVSKLQ